MAETPTQPQSKRRGWLRFLLWGGGSLVLVLIVAYFVATSGGFFKGVILPKVSKAMGAEVTVSDAAIRPFSQVVLRGLKVQVPGREPLLTANEARARYSLWAILGGNLNVEELALISPVMQAIYQADGTSNLDPFLQPATPPAKEPPPSSPSKPMQVDLKKLLVENATVRVVTLSKEGGRDAKELSNARLSLDNLKNAQTAKLALSSDLAFDVVPPPGTNAALKGKLVGEFDLALTDDLQPASVKGATRLTVDNASGGYAQAAGLAATLDCDLTPTELKQLALRFLKGTVELGTIRLSGPFNAAKQEGKLRLDIQNIDRQVLNLAGAASGLDFGTTVINSTNAVELASAGQALTIHGQTTVAKLSVTREGVTTPAMDLALNYGVAVDQAKETALVRALKLTGVQNQRPILDVSLSAPLAVAWGKATDAVGDAVAQAVVTNFSLAEWKALLGDMAGTLNASLKLDSRKAGQELGFLLEGEIRDFAGLVASNRVSEVGVLCNTRGTLTNLQFVALQALLLEVKRRAETAFKLTGSGTFDQAATNADLRLSLQASLPRVLELAPQPDLTASNGTVAMNAQVSIRQQTQTVTGNLTLASLSGRYTEYPLKDLGGRVDFDMVQQGPKLDLRQVRLALPPTARATNEARLSGQVDTTQSNAITGALRLEADSLDLTAYYNMISPETPAAPATSATGQQPPPPPPPQEPEPVTFPVKNFTVDARVGRCYLREVEITNFLLGLKLDGSQVTLKPAQMALNGGPVTADMDFNLGVTGYVYRVDLQARDVGLAPLVNSFQPEYKGQIGGTGQALLQLSGAGLTDPSIQKNFSGQFDIGTTNLNLQLANVRLPVLKEVIWVVVKLPGIIRDPKAAVTSLMARFTGEGDPTDKALSTELAKSPIDVIELRAKAGAGKVDLERAFVQSLAFQVNSRGAITLAPVLTNSPIDLPVGLTLRREIADKLGWRPSDTPTNAAYVKLPDFVTMKGTVGEAKPSYNLAALSPLRDVGLKALSNLAGDKGAGVVNQIGSLFQGSKSTNTVTDTNAPAKKPFNPFDLIPKRK
jgi:hypothetical protein